jgi:hypothetical protein
MDFLIIYKWIKYWDPVTSNPPSIITTMVNMVLKLGKTVNIIYYDRKIVVVENQCGVLMVTHLKI